MRNTCKPLTDEWFEFEGFKKTYLSDNSGFWYEKKIKHPFLKNCTLIIEDKVITLEACNDENDYNTIYTKKFNDHIYYRLNHWLKTHI